ncbi:MAG: DUF1289 domain-containing protein [Alphaproteobacteria bacterium]
MGLMTATEPPPPIATPCVKVCVVDGPSRLCLGCYRTLPEIVRWQRYTDQERADIMAALPARRAANKPG